jgi:hypothetical protein
MLGSAAAAAIAAAAEAEKKGDGDDTDASKHDDKPTKIPEPRKPVGEKTNGNGDAKSAVVLPAARQASLARTSIKGDAIDPRSVIKVSARSPLLAI